jgi:hypothetical protein
MIKLRKMIRAGHVAYIEEMKHAYRFWSENLKEEATQKT